MDNTNNIDNVDSILTDKEIKNIIIENNLTDIDESVKFMMTNYPDRCDKSRIRRITYQVQLKSDIRKED